MLNIQSIMLLVLGFSVASLIACLLAPLYGRRLARLAIETLKESTPITKEEFHARQDQMRAQYALEIHDLQKKVHNLSLKCAHQKVEISKREAHVQNLENEIANLNTTHLEHENARRVLEVTITERIPKIEERLIEARKLLDKRDLEISTLSHSAEKQADALQEATQINAQQQAEIQNLRARLSRRNSKNRETSNDNRTEIEFALRGEIENLRGRLKDQAQTLTFLQKNLVGRNEFGGGENSNAENEMIRLSKILANAEKAFKESSSNEYTQGDAFESLDEHIAHLRNQNAEQTRLIDDLKAEILAKDKILLDQSLLNNGESTHQGLADRLAFISETWKKAPAAMGQERPTLTELLNAPKSLEARTLDTITRRVRPSDSNHLLDDAHKAKDLASLNLKENKDESQDTQQKANPKSSLLQRIKNIDKT